jgi:6-pyruvoyl-tetrahydropterin synthase
MYEVGAVTAFRAFHVMPVEGPEGELHPHDYRVEVIAERDALDERGMVVDLDVLRAAMAAVLDPVRETDLAPIRPPDTDGVTVEVLARWIHASLAGPLAAAGADLVRVRVWESPSEFAGYRSAVGSAASDAAA